MPSCLRWWVYECWSSFCCTPPHATLVFRSHQSHWSIFKHFIFRMLFSTFFPPSQTSRILLPSRK
jgi:hypothetical protein